MSDQPKLGELIVGGERDAIHIAIAPVTAAAPLTPGAHIGFILKGDTDLVAPSSGSFGEIEITPIGIVDPFLRVPIKKGERFYMFLYPQTITSLKHGWTHPSFEVEVPKIVNATASERWLRDFCEQHDCPDYETIMSAINGEKLTFDSEWYGSWGYLDGEMFHFNGRDAHSEIPDEFWNHVEVVLGRRVKKRPSYFSCSC